METVPKRMLSNKSGRLNVTVRKGDGGTEFISFHSSMDLHPFVGPWSFLQLPNHFYTVGRTKS
jgi:hypothetical protein